MSYSLDLRKKVIKYVMSGGTRVSASKIFNLGEKTVRTWVKRFKETGDYDRLPQSGGATSKVKKEIFIDYIKANPDKTLKEIGNNFNMSHEGAAYNLRKYGFTYKKKPFYTQSAKKIRGLIISKN